MNRVKVTCEVNTYDKPAKPSVFVHSHWNEREKIEIQIGEERVTVVGDDLIQAILNCMNTGRHI